MRGRSPSTGLYFCTSIILERFPSKLSLYKVRTVIETGHIGLNDMAWRKSVTAQGQKASPQPSLVALNSEQHRDMAFLKDCGWSFAATSPILTIVGAEAHRCAAFFPVVIMDVTPETASQETRDLELISLHATTSGENWCVAPDGRWLAGYIPAVLRAAPFRLIRSDDPEGRSVLCVDELSPLLARTQASESDRMLPLFNTDGSLSDFTRSQLDFIAKVTSNHLATKDILQKIAQENILIPWSASVVRGGQNLEMQNLQVVDENALNALSDEGFLRLRRAGALPLIYSHLLSLSQVENLQRLARFYDQNQQRPDQNTASDGNSSSSDVEFKF